LAEEAEGLLTVGLAQRQKTKSKR